MASKVLKGLTIQIGGDTSELSKALDGVEKQSRNLSSELGQINKLLKLDPGNVELLAQKQKVLADAIGNTEKKLDTLREAEKQVQAQFERGEVSEAQYRALQREIIETENKLNKYKNAADETADAVEKLGKEAGKAADEIEEQADKTEEAEEATEDLDSAALDLAKGGLATLAAAATAAVTAIVAMAEESREYRTEMGKLDTAFTDSGHTTEAATKTYKTLQGVLGETDQAVEAANHLAKLCTTEEELVEWTEIATGVYATFGASLPIEGLTEAANEVARCGQLTGPLTDAINWAAEAGETFGVVLKDATEENEEWNKAVAEATSAEDFFNLALQECSSEQERQQLITKTLTRLYGSAATQYKKTNKEVIRANEANEKWNSTVAKIGKNVEPVITDIKELGATLLEDASEPLEDIADFIRMEVIPAIKDVSGWVKQNGPTIEATVIGIAAAIVTFEAASIAATVAQNGLKGAILATEVAQKALNLAQAATPWGLVATAVVGVTAALVALSLAMEDAQQPADILTKEERELMAAADEAAQAFRDQQQATNDALGGITSQMGHVTDLATELQSLADASGKVKQKDQERAQFILNELNEALGTEYTMVNGVIQKYDELTGSINEVIQAKLANSLVEAANADYVTAIQEEEDALKRVTFAEQDYQNQLAITQEKEAAYIKAKEDWYLAMESGNHYAIEGTAQMMAIAEEAYNKEADLLDEKKSAYDQAAIDYGNYYNTIANYEEAQAAVLSGNYQKAVDILAKKGDAFGSYSDAVDTETAKVLDTLYKEAIDAGLEAQRIKKNFENGVDGYTRIMVINAQTDYNNAMQKFATAYADAEGVGKDLGDGLSGGMEKKRSTLLSKAKSLVQGVISAMRKEAESHSPARKTIDFGEDLGEGAEIGIENKTKDVKRAATDQAAAILDAYSEQEVAGQRTLRGVAEKQLARQTAGQNAIATANSGVLDKILSAIEKGQVLLLDGDAVVGGTADRFNKKLGMMQVLSARGAK